MKSKSKVNWRLLGKRSLSALLSIALVITMGSGISSVVDSPQKAQAESGAEKVFKTSPTWSYYASDSTKSPSNGTWSTGIYVATGSQQVKNVSISGTVFLEIRKGVTLTCVGDNGSARTPGKPGIELTGSNKLIVLGEGTLVARGGNAGNGSNGSDGSSPSNSSSYVYSGSGGSGGAGGGGAGAGIGTAGGSGGSGGSYGSGTSRYCDHSKDGYGSGGSGSSGDSGSSASTSMGYLYALGCVTISAQGGAAGYGGSGGSYISTQVHMKRDQGKFRKDRHGYAVGGAGGGGGGGGTAGAGIGIGGGGGAGGAGGGGGGVYVNDTKGNWSSWSSLYPGGGVGGSGGRNGSSGGGSKGSYGGAGGSSSRSVGSSSGSIKTVTRNSLASISTSGTGGKSAGISSREKYAYTDQPVNISMQDEKSGLVTTDGWDNINEFSKSSITYATVTLGRSTFDKITDVTHENIHKPGYTFEGWYSSPTGGKKVIDAEGNVVENVTDYTCNGVYNSVGNKLYAHWKRNTYNLIYNANGGGFKGNKSSVSKNVYTGETLETLEASQVPTRTGYFLLGYNTKKDGTGEWIYGSNRSGDQTTDAHVKADWETIEAERVRESEEDLKDNEVVKEENTSASTFLKKDWNTQKTIKEGGKQLSAYLASGTLTQAQNKMKGIYPYEGDTEIYAQWAPIHYTLTYFSEDSSNEAKWIGEKYNVPYFNVVYKSLEDFKVTRKHYEFKGWNIYPSQTWGMYEPNRIYRTSLTQEDGDTVSLYAAWKMTDNYAITYNGNGGAGVPANGFTFKDSKATDEDVYKISSKIPTRENYTFTGWNTEVDGSGDTWEKGKAVPGSINGNLTLYAQWKLNPSVTYHANGGSFSVTPDKKHIKAGQKFNTLKDDELPTREGYQFVGWSDSATTSENAKKYAAGAEVEMPDKNLTLYALWEKEGYGVSATVFNENPDEMDEVTEYFSLELEIEKDQEYKKFTKSTTMGDGSYSSKEMSVTYTAKNAEDNDFKVKYKEDFAFRLKVPEFVDTSDLMVYANGAVLINKRKETKTEADGDYTYYYYTVTNAVKAQELTVTGLKYKTYALEFKTNGGEIPESKAIGSYNYGTETILPEPERIGYTFKGWYADSAFSNTAVKKILATDKGDKTFYAKWEANQYTIKFDATVYNSKEVTVNGPNGSTTEIQYEETKSGGVTQNRERSTSQIVTYDTPTELAGNGFKYHTDVTEYVNGSIAYDNYDTDKAGEKVTFAGWSTQKGDSTVTYVPGSRINNLCTGADGDKEITLYAVWKTSNYKLTYNANGGKIEKKVQTIQRDGDGHIIMVDGDGNPVDEGGTPKVEEKIKQVSSYTEEKQKCTDVTLQFDGMKRDGYKFLGWTTKPLDNLGKPATEPEYYTEATYPNGDMDSDEDDNVLPGDKFDKDTVLYAVWAENSYTINFDVNGGTKHVAQVAEGTATYSTVDIVQTNAVSIETTIANDAPVYQSVTGDTYYCKMSNDPGDTTYYELTNWKPYAALTKVENNDLGSAASVTGEQLVRAESFRGVIDSANKKKYPIFKYTEGDRTIYLCVKEEVTDASKLYEVTEPTDGIDITDSAKVSTDAYQKDGVEVAYGGVKDKLTLIQDYEGAIDHTGHNDDEVFKQQITYSKSARLVKNEDGDALFTIKNGGSGADTFEAETRKDEGLNVFTGFYKLNTQDVTKFSHFLGWSLDKNATEPDYLIHDKVEKLISGADGDNEITLYAVWSDDAVSYAMFNGNGGTFTDTDATESYKALRTKVAGDNPYKVSDSLIPEDDTEITAYAKNGSICESSVDGSKNYTLAKAGYTFVGWTTDLSLTDDALEQNIADTKQALQNGFDTDHYLSQTYYAVWTPNKVKVTFDGNGSEDASYTQDVEYDTVTALDANTFTRTGYHFVRWATEVYEGNAMNELGYADKDTVYFSSDDADEYKNGITLYAIWEENPSHSLIYDANGGYGGPGNAEFVEEVEGIIYISEQFTSQEGDDGQTTDIITVAMPKRDGYKFLGWSDDPNADDALPGYKYQESTTKAESESVSYPTWTSHNGDTNKTLYAVWEKIQEYDVTYLTDNDDGSAVFKEKSYLEGDEFGLYFDRTPVKTGYDFIGWSTQSDTVFDENNPNDNIYRSGDGKKFTMPGDNVKFYPVWKVHTYKVTYKTENNSSIECSERNIAYDTDYTFCGLETSETVTEDKVISKLFAETESEQEKAKQYNPKAGYTFVGWSTCPGGKVDYQAGEKVQNLSSVDGAEVMLYAVYEPKTSKYTLVNQYTVTDLDEHTDRTTQDKELGSITMGEVLPVLSDIPTKYGYSFGGYFTEKNGQGELYYDDKLATSSEHAVNESAEDVKLYAYWIPDSFSIYYEYEGQKVGTQDVHYGENITTLAQEDLTGLTLDDDMVLAGWKYKKDNDSADFSAKGSDTSVYESTHFYQNGNNIVVYAHVGKATKSTVSYNPNGGSNEPVDGNKYETGDIVEVNFDKTPKKTGYTFLGWAKTSSAEKPFYYQTDDPTDLNAKTSFSISTDTVLYAVWKANSYTITYHQNYTAQDSSAKNSNTESASVKDPLGYETEGYHFRGGDTFSRTGYTLVGWAVTPETGVTYTLDQELTSPLTGTNEGNVNLYAVWSANSYIVSYDANKPENVDAEVTGSMKNTEMTYDKEGTLRANAYKLSGYKFIGWSSTPDGAVEYKDSSEVFNLCEQGEKVLYAVWKNKADVTGEDEDVDWESKTMVTIMSNVYSIPIVDGEKPNLDNLVITVVYSDGMCRVVKDFTTNIDTLDPDEDESIIVTYTEGGISRTIEIPIRKKSGSGSSGSTDDPSTDTPSTDTPSTDAPSTNDPSNGGSSNSSSTNNSTTNNNSSNNSTIINSANNNTSNLATDNQSSMILSTVEAVEQSLNKVNTDKQDLAGSTYSKLKLQAVATKKSKIANLKWSKVKGASSYIVYGAVCGGKMKKVATVKAKGSKKTYQYKVKKLKGKKYYKYLVVACKPGTTAKNITATKSNVKATTDMVVAISKNVYVTAKDKKMGNPSKLKAKSKLTVKRRKSKKLKLKVTKTKKKVKKYGKWLRYESANPKIAKVSAAGKITGVKAGKTYVYAYGQNGICKKVKVTVKK